MSLTNWKDLPNTSTPVNKNNLNNINNGLVNVGPIVDDTYKINILHSNLLSNAIWEQGSISGNDGSLFDSTTRIRTKAIKVNPNTTYTIDMNTNYAYGIMGYSSTSASTYTETIKMAFVAGKNTFTTGNNTNYIRLVVGKGPQFTDTITTSAVNILNATISLGNYIIIPSIVVDGEEIYNKNNLEIYSSEETRIGTWSNGKPLYRKLIYTSCPTTSANGNYAGNDLTISSDNEIAMIEWGYFKDYNSRLPINYTSNAGYMMKAFMLDANTIRLNNNNTIWNGNDVVLSILFTKTTD